MARGRHGTPAAKAIAAVISRDTDLPRQAPILPQLWKAFHLLRKLIRRNIRPIDPQ
jgi:hypothetical protein